MLSRLRLMDFRCYESFSWDVPQQGAIILGNNAQGKTSLLEAVCFLLRLYSPRTSKLPPLSRHGKSRFGVRGVLPGQVRRIIWSPQSSDLQVNGDVCKDQRSYLSASYPVVWLGNDDLAMICAGAEVRRRYLDFLGSQWHPGYRMALANFKKSLKSRNFLLKKRHINQIQLDVYTQQFIRYGSELRQLRTQLLNLLCPHVFSAYRHISSAQEYIRLVYHESGGADLPLILEKNKERDAQYGQTQQGPHRDDLLIFLNDREASLFASEGQQRTIAIALKLAQSSLLTEETGYIPIHLIDDVFGELDPSRRMAFLQALPKEAQCLITTTHLDWLQGTSCPIPTFRLEASHLTPM